MAVIESFVQGAADAPFFQRSPHKKISAPNDFLSRQTDILRERGFQIATTQTLTTPRVAVRPHLEQVPLEHVGQPQQVLDEYTDQHLRSLAHVALRIGSVDTYIEVLYDLERLQPGTLRRLFLIDPEGYRGVGGYHWLATADRVTVDSPLSRHDLQTRVGVEHMVILASYNGKNFTTGLRRIDHSEGYIGVMPLVIPVK